ncbi:glycosyltransferase [Luteithermobacter gelatinilyticus]|uniref:glycosyltransferase n=1 Tax=Luteithermobacter gelatinilyticus TaxID=2582913 RepID=UPI0011059544|nr:glycosyltransferase [Luteithermobacter gelatinilyticus]
MSGQQKKLPIIALDYTGWDGNWMNRQHILSRLGRRGWPVLYSNGARYYHHMDFSMPFGAAEKKDHVKIYKAGSLLPRNYKFPALDRLAIKAHCRDLKKKAGLKRGDDFITFCFHPDFYPYVEELAAPYVMFHIYDVYQKFSKKQAKTDFTEKLVKKSDLITAASEVMWDEVVADSSIVPKIIHNGVDFSKYRKVTKLTDSLLDEITSISGVKIGYVGAINLKIDFQTIYTLAKQRDDIHFIFIGNILEKQILSDAVAGEFFSKCKKEKNIHFLGPVKRELVPSALRMMDINAIFYTQNDQDWVQAGYPIKLNEYLATGKPVITSFMPIIRQYFSDTVAICHTLKEWVDAIDMALDGKGVGTPETRIEMARRNDWENRVDQLEKLMFAMLA